LVSFSRKKIIIFHLTPSHASWSHISAKKIRRAKAQCYSQFDNQNNSSSSSASANVIIIIIQLIKQHIDDDKRQAVLLHFSTAVLTAANDHQLAH
jgi:hypothetical protein